MHSSLYLGFQSCSVGKAVQVGHRRLGFFFEALMIVETWGVYVAASIGFASRCACFRNPPQTSMWPEVVYFINGTSVGIFQNATILRILRILRRTLCSVVLRCIQLCSCAPGCCERHAWRSFCARCPELMLLIKGHGWHRQCVLTGVERLCRHCRCNQIRLLHAGSAGDHHLRAMIRNVLTLAWGAL